MSTQDSGVRVSRKPASALWTVSLAAMSSSCASYLHWRRVTKGLAELASYFVLRREVNLFEEFRGNGQAASRADTLQSLARIGMMVQMVAFHLSAIAVDGMVRVEGLPLLKSFSNGASEPLLLYAPPLVVGWSMVLF